MNMSLSPPNCMTYIVHIHNLILKIYVPLKIANCKIPLIVINCHTDNTVILTSQFVKKGEEKNMCQIISVYFVHTRMRALCFSLVGKTTGLLILMFA